MKEFKIPENNANKNDELIKYLMLINNEYLFNVSGTSVKVVFSKKTNAPTIEDALVNISTRRFG